MISTDSTSDYYNGLPIINGGSDTYLKVYTDTEDYDIVYVATASGVIYRTINGGVHWVIVENTTKSINDSSIVSFFDNSIYFACNSNGINVFEDDIRDEMSIKIESDNRINYFDIKYLGMGDAYNSDLSTINFTTSSKNTDITDNRKRTVFKVDEKTNFVSFKFLNKEGYIKTDKIYIGDITHNAITYPLVLQNGQAVFPRLFRWSIWAQLACDGRLSQGRCALRDRPGDSV